MSEDNLEELQANYDVQQSMKLVLHSLKASANHSCMSHIFNSE
jgi:hypothetical protein